MFQLTPYEESKIRNADNSADLIGVAPFIAAEIAIHHGSPLTIHGQRKRKNAFNHGCDVADAAYLAWATDSISK